MEFPKTNTGFTPGNPNYAFNYVYNYTDHLGNVRLSYAKDPQTGNLKILDESHYYPFGLKHQEYQANGFTTNPIQGVIIAPVGNNPYKYKYNGKEWQDELGLGLYDYGWRNYDPALGRWMNMDPLAEKYPGWSPYNYTLNNPVMLVDPDGRSVDVPPGDYFDKQGNHLGNDGIDDGKIYQVEGTSRFNINDFKEGGEYYENQIAFNENNGDGFSVTEIGFDSDLSLLARIGYAEFRGANDTEQKVGMDITLNRVESERYPNTLKEVIEQPLQYSSLNEGDSNKPYYENPAGTLTNRDNRNAWIRSVSNSFSILNGSDRGISKGATLYYSPRSMIPKNSLPKWNFKKLKEITVPGVRSSYLKLYKEL
ncbi:MAG: RHS repeat-associated core domain-containing protein [Moheibacter sp.]